MDSIDCNSNLMNLIKKISDELGLYDILDNDFYNVMLSVIKSEIKEDISEDMIRNIIINYVVNNKDKEPLIINFICKKIDISDDYNNNIKELNKLIEFLLIVNYHIDIDSCINIINNNKKIDLILESIISKNKKIIIKDDYLMCLINAYSILKNIEYDIDNKEQLEEFETRDDNYLNFSSYYRTSGKRFLTDEEQKELFLLAQAGDRNARDDLIERNIGLVINMAFTFCVPGMSILDLIQEGCIGLIDAIEKFDVSRGNKFSSYAVPCIHTFISREVQRICRTIKIPNYLYYRINKYLKTKTKLEDKLCRVPTILEIAKEFETTPEYALHLEKSQTEVISLDMEYTGDEGTSNLQNYLSSDEDSPEDILMKDDMIINVRSVFEKCNLNSNERKVLEHRYGLNGCEIKKYKDIAILLNLTRQRVCQIEKSALYKLRNVDGIEHLATFLDKPEEGLVYLKENKIKKK